MKLSTTGVIAAVSIVIGISAVTFVVAATSRPSLMSPDDYQAGKVQIARQMSEEIAACDELTNNPRLVCTTEARSRARVSQAELDYRYRGTPTEAREVELTTVRARYEIERSKCSGLSGFKRDSCIVSAHADKAKALMAMR